MVRFMPVEVGYGSIARVFVNHGTGFVQRCDLDGWSDGRGAELGTYRVSPIDCSDKGKFRPALPSRPAIGSWISAGTGAV